MMKKAIAPIKANATSAIPTTLMPTIAPVLRLLDEAGEEEALELLEGMEAAALVAVEVLLGGEGDVDEVAAAATDALVVMLK